MALTVPDFLGLFPEFADAPVPLIQAKLNEAIQMVPDVIWGGSGAPESLTQQGTFLYCAQFLAQSPFARKMAATSDTGATAYDERLKKWQRIVSSGYRSL